MTDGPSPRALWGWPGFLCLLAAYLLVHALLRLWISPVVTIDDARETVFGQTLQWGYQPRQPPLYNWLVWAAFRAFGVGVHSLTLVKYAVLAVAYGFVYASARRVLTDPRLAILATWSLLLIVPISWFPHEALTHSVAALAACAATFYALLRLEAAGSLRAYLAFGLVIGLGLLSKFTYPVFAAALLAAALTLERFRARLLDPCMGLALALAGALVLPYAVWFTAEGFAFGRMYAEQVRVGAGQPYLAGVVSGLYYIVRITLYYVTPLWLVLLLVFPGAYTARRPARPSTAGSGQLLERFFLSVLALLTAGALANALAFLKFRWMIPAFCLLPLYAFSRVERAGVDARRLRWFAAILLAAEVAIVGGIFGVVYAGSRFGRPYKFNEPYDVVAREVAAAGFTRGTIVAGRGPLGGNLRFRFPDARVVSVESPYYVPPATGGGQCLVVWEQGKTDGAAVPADLAALMASALDAPLPGAEPPRVVDARYRFAEDQFRRVHFLLLPEGLGRCR